MDNINLKTYKPNYTFSKKRQLLVFFLIILFGILLYCTPARNHESSYGTPIQMFLAVIVTLVGLYFWLTTKPISIVQVDTLHKTITITRTNNFGKEKIYTHKIGEITYEYFLDKSRTGFNNILVLKLKNEILKLDNNSGFSTQTLEDLKHCISTVV